MKKIKSLEILLSFGAILVLIAGLSLIFTSGINITYQILGMSILSIFMFVYSIICQKLLKVESTSKFTFVLSLIAILVTYVFAGCNELFGSWFYLLGDGVHLFLSSILGLAGLESILVALRFKNSNFIHITFTCVLAMIFHLFAHFDFEFELCLIVVGALLLLFNTIKINKVLYNFTNVAIFVYALLCLLLGYNGPILYGSIILAINAAGILNLLHKFKSFESELLSVIIFGATFFSFIPHYLDTPVNVNLLVVGASFVLAIIDMAASSFNVFDNKFCKIAFKIVTSICLFSLFNTIADSMALSLAGIFMIISSVAQSYIFKERNYEEFLFPIKSMYFLTLLPTVLPINISNMVVATSLVIFTLVYYYLNKFNIYKKIGIVLNVISLLYLISTLKEPTIIMCISALLTLLISYIVICEGKTNTPRTYIYGTFISLLAVVLTNVTHEFVGEKVVLVILAIYGLLYMLLNTNNKYNFIIGSLTLLLGINGYINSIIESSDLALVITTTIELSIILVDGFILFDSEGKGIDIFTSISSSIVLLYLMTTSSSLLVSLYLIVVGILFILVNSELKNFKIISYAGFAITIFNIIGLLRYLEGLPTAVYTLIIGLIIILVVSIIVFKYNKKQSLIKRCPNCNKEINDNQVFCGECGTKLK